MLWSLWGAPEAARRGRTLLCGGQPGVDALSGLWVSLTPHRSEGLCGAWGEGGVVDRV